MSNKLVFSALWADAVTEYEKQTERKLDRDHVFGQFKSLDDLKHAVDNERAQFDDFRSRHGKLYSALAKSMSPMQSVLKVIQDGLGNTPYAPANAVFGAASYLLQACSLVSKAYDGIEELFERMHDITVRLHEYEYGNMEASLQAKMTDILAYFLDIFGRAEACLKRKRIKEWARSVFLGKDGNGISSSVDRLRRYVESELGLVIALTYGRVQNVQITASDTLSEVRSLRTGFERDRQRHFSDQEEKTVSDHLKTGTTDDIAREHAANLEKLTKGTGLWIRDDLMFQAWEQEKAPILWVFGKPGVGKTMLAARTIETLQNRYPQHSDIPSLTSVSYLYFKEGNAALQNCAQMWKAAALQITKANDRFKKHVLETIGKKQDDTFASARQIWRQLFLDFFSEDTSLKYPTSLAFLIIDGLDEAPEAERVKFLSCLAELVDRSTNNRTCRIQIAVFARPHVRADSGFEKVGFRTHERIIEVTPDKNTLDIEAFVRQRLGEISVLKVLKQRKAHKEYQTLAKQIYSSVQMRSQGMFLWARLVFYQIRDSPSPEAIRESLRGAPEGLDNMLYHVFKRLEAEQHAHRSYLPDLLSWILCAYRPLYIAELFVLILISAKQHYYVIEDHLKGQYSSLFDVTGPVVELEDDEQDAETSTNDRSSEQDDFDFLDQPHDSDNDETENGVDNSDCETDEAQQPTESVLSTDAGDEEDIFDMPDHWFQTTVRFSHARIRDYLMTEGNPSTRRWQESSIVPDNLHTTRFSVFQACLQICFNDTTDGYSVYSLKTYAKVNWIKHLVEIDFNMIPSSAAVQLARSLAMLFHDGSKLLKVSEDVSNDFIETWFCTNKYSNLVRKIITEQLHNLDEHLRGWALSVTQSARELFRPFISACARRWLTKTGWDDAAYLDKSEREVFMMYAFSLLTDEGTNDGSMDIFNVESGMWNIPLDAIESIANMEPIPKSEHYYAGLAWIMMEADEEDYTERAIEYFKKALELKPGGWMAMEGLARCYGDNLHEYETAIHWMEDAIHHLPSAEKFDVEFYLLARVADWKLQLDSEQESVQIAQAAYEKSREFCYGNGTASDASILRSIKHYIEALYRIGNFSKIIELLFELDRTTTWKQNTTLWAAFLRAQNDGYYNVLIFDKIGKISKEEESVALQDFMRVSIKNIIQLDSESIAEDQTTWLATQAAEWQYHYAFDPEQSTELWQQIVSLVDQSNELVQQFQSGRRSMAAKFLAMMSLNAAIRAFTSGVDPSAHVQKLEDLASHKQGNKRYYRASYPALSLGLWLHEYKKADQEVWRACIRPSIKQALYLLSDEDPWNDQQAYAQLGAALLAAGDTRNASIALGITMKPLEDQRAMQQMSKETNGSSQKDFSEGELVPTAVIPVDDDVEAPIENTAHQQIRHPSTLESTPDNAENPYREEENPSTGDESLPHDESKMNGEKASSSGRTDDDENDEQINPKYAGFDCMWTCDGPCESSQTSYAELYFCRVCDDVCFCEKCIELVRDDQMPFRYCASDHPHVRVFPVIDEAKRLTDALVERNFEVQQEWLAELQAVWDG